MAKKARCFRDNPDTLTLEGTVTFYSAKELLDEINDVFPSGKNITIELQKVTRYDSAIFVILLALQRLAVSKQQQIHFIGMPVSMQALANLYNLNFLNKL